MSRLAVWLLTFATIPPAQGGVAQIAELRVMAINSGLASTTELRRFYQIARDRVTTRRVGTAMRESPDRIMAAAPTTLTKPAFN